MKWVYFILISFLQMMPCHAWSEETDCGMPNVEVKYEHSCDAEMACEGINRALNFFDARGYNLFGEIKIEFSDTVYVEKINKGEVEIIKLQACGYYCSLNGICNITSWQTMRDEQIKLFGELDITKELYISLIVHEVSHCLYYNNFELNDLDMDRPLTEFISYSIQIETMKSREKSNILKLYPEDIFTSMIEINTLNHAMNPHKFGIMSYRYFKKHPDILDLIFNGEVKSGDKFFFDYNFFHYQ